MSQVRSIQIGGNEVFVEITPAEITAPKGSRSYRLPEGSERVGLQDKLGDATEIIRNSIQGLAKSTIAALKDLSPSEFQIEIGMAFKGEANPIPVIVKTGAEASLKVTVKWKQTATT